MKNIKYCFYLYFAVLALLLGGCESTPVAHSIGGKTMGTNYSIKYFGVEQPSLHADIKMILASLENTLSTYKPDSEVSRFNAGKAFEWFPVSPATAKIVVAAQEISRLSDGAFDITVGPLVELWGFGAGEFLAKPPAAELIAERLNYVGYKLIEVQTNPPALKKQHVKTAIDLSAIAKGYAIDQLALLLDAKNIDSWLIEVGGEIRTRGKKPDFTSWKVAIEKPLSESRSMQNIISLNDAAIATSGDYRNFFEYKNVRYSHTINPTTGWPVPSNIGSVSVVTESAMYADSLATALLVLGHEKALKLSNDKGFAISMTIRDDAGELREVISPAFAKYVGWQK
ncbi:MAG: FAD:protein FMN transferase [Gammaproteobacteria bacterium]|nr:FAD:protein FMN transferase [Gammaproteobacteria bacterium]